MAEKSATIPDPATSEVVAEVSMGEKGRFDPRPRGGEGLFRMVEGRPEGAGRTPLSGAEFVWEEIALFLTMEQGKAP